MSEKTSMKDNAHAFRAALIGDRMKAERLLKRYPGLIDYPVYGDSESALHFFAVENQIDVVNWLLARGANPQGVAGDDSPLHNAAQLGHEDVCRALLKAGSDPNRPDDGGETALHKASAHGYVRVIELLLAYGADPAVAEACGQLPVDMALPRKRDEVRAVFVRHADREPHTSPTRSSP